MLLILVLVFMRNLRMLIFEIFWKIFRDILVMFVVDRYCVRVEVILIVLVYGRVFCKNYFILLGFIDLKIFK